MLNFFKNLIRVGYKPHPEAVIISCYFNPQNSAYRLKAFNEFYNSIKHMNHSIIECVIGGTEPQLPKNENIKRVYTQNLLWHKEALLNKLVAELPKKYKYVFWVDADVIFTNKDWLFDGVEQLQQCDILQPFEYCLHLDKDELKPSFDYENFKKPNILNNPSMRYKQMWRSFCANYYSSHFITVKQQYNEGGTISDLSSNKNYDIHGHVGFAWGAKREILERVPLYDKALIGGADHIIAHAAAGQIPNCCIDNSFTDNLQEVYDWSRKFYSAVKGRIGYVKGDLYHIWHGDIDKRQYLKRIKDFTPTTKTITEKDHNGLYVTNNKQDEAYIRNYFRHREVNGSGDDGFLTSMAIGYMTDSTMMGALLGGNMMGAMVGDMLNNSDNQQMAVDVAQSDTLIQNTDSLQNNTSENFS